MNRPTSSRFKFHSRWMAFGLLASVVLIVPVILLLTKPVEISEVMLRLGGRIITGAAQRPGVVVAASVTTLLLVWISIAVRCWWEGSSASSATSQPTSQDSLVD